MLKVLLLGLMLAGYLAGCTHLETAISDDQLEIASSEDHSSTQTAETGEACKRFGPQTPRDIANVAGANSVTFPQALPPQNMNLCNIHFHNAAEHKAPAFSVVARQDEQGHGGGYQCGIGEQLAASELTPYKNNQCGDVKPGDTIEVHWVHLSCDVAPGPGLESCLSDSCANPSLRVETQVFTVVNDVDALDFGNFGYAGKPIEGVHQASALPSDTGTPVQFLGSTTGPKYTEQACSPMQVTWSVRPHCAKVHIGSLSKWCAGNEFNENHAHGVRELVTNSKLLSPIK